MDLRAFEWYRRSRLWVVPSTGAFLALVLALVTLSIDYFLIKETAPFPLFTGTANTARDILTLVGGAIATLTALVLTIVAVVIQLATQALSPRAVRTFLQDAHSHVTIGTFVTTFTYVLILLQGLNYAYDPSDDLIRSVSITVAFLLAVFSLAMFISYVDHIVQMSRVTSIIDRIASETRHAIETRDAADSEGGRTVDGSIPDAEPDHIVRAPRRGVIMEIDIEALLSEVADQHATVVMIPAVGDFIPTGGRLLDVYGQEDLDVDALLKTVVIDAERSILQDVPFGMRLLVDIAERALSPSMNDPTTAVQVLDQLHDLLLMIGTRPFPNGWHADGDGNPCLFVPVTPWENYVALAFEEIRHYGADSVQVLRRMRSVIADLCRHLPEDLHPPLERQSALLDRSDEHFIAPAERQPTKFPDAQGIGSGLGFGAPDGDERDEPVSRGS